MKDVVDISKRNVAVDFVRFLATILVLNSHMGVCYGNYSILATGGGIGDALFFFISGFALFMGKRTDCLNWFKKRINRIYPTIIATGLVASTFFDQQLGFLDVITADNYWFLQCIFVYYLLLYPIIYKRLRISVCITVSIVIVIIAFFITDFDGRLFYGIDNYFRWIFYLPIALIGGEMFNNNDKISYKRWHLLAVLLCILGWYAINYISRYNEYLSIISFIPLAGICYFAYSIGKSAFVAQIFESKVIGNIIFIIGNLCLESYMIQKYIITDSLNHIFPLNIPIVMVLVFVVSYLLRILASIIGQIFDSKPFQWKALLLYKLN